ncbi:MAG: site-2 protease family protein [Acidobacteriaceae bacterium]
MRKVCMDPSFAVKIFEFIVLLFALSFHEAAHAWTASRLGDPTARMLGRVTLNPAKHIDPLGTIIFPLVALFAPIFGGGLIFGWAKPTPVTGRNFKNYKRDDMLVTLAGPTSNLLLAIGSFFVLLLMERYAPLGRQCLQGLLTGAINPELMSTAPVVFPLTLIFYFGITLNLVLAVFNLMPFPPLDGSHLFRHVISGRFAAIYDNLGWIGFILAFIVGGWVTMRIVSPILTIFLTLLLHG